MDLGGHKHLDHSNILQRIHQCGVFHTQLIRAVVIPERSLKPIRECVCVCVCGCVPMCKYVCVCACMCASPMHFCFKRSSSAFISLTWQGRVLSFVKMISGILITLGELSTEKKKNKTVTINHSSCPSETRCLVEKQTYGSWSASHVAVTVPGAGNTATRKADVAKHMQSRHAGILTGGRRQGIGKGHRHTSEILCLVPEHCKKQVAQ